LRRHTGYPLSNSNADVPMQPIAKLTFAAALLLFPPGLAGAQTPSATGGGANTAPTSGAIDRGTTDQPGTGVSTINPNAGQPAPGTSLPPVTTGQSPSGARVQSTTPPRTTQAPAAAGGSTVGQSRGAKLRDPKEDPTVMDSEQEVSKRIKNICKGC
jgi:hypothetical protein